LPDTVVSFVNNVSYQKYNTLIGTIELVVTNKESITKIVTTVRTNSKMTYLDISGMLSLNQLNLNRQLIDTIIISDEQYPFISNINFQDCNLSQENVDKLLLFAVNSLVNNGYLYLDFGTNSTPSAAGLANKAILQGRGWTVTNN